MKSLTIKTEISGGQLLGKLRGYAMGRLCLEMLQTLFPVLSSHHDRAKFLLTISDTKPEGAQGIDAQGIDLFHAIPDVGSIFPRWAMAVEIFPRWAMAVEAPIAKVYETAVETYRSPAGGDVFMDNNTDILVYTVIRRLFGKSANFGRVWVTLTPVEKKNEKTS